MATYIGDILQGYLYDKVKTLADADFFNKVMQFDNDPSNVASSDATFIFAGPPVLNPEIGWDTIPGPDEIKALTAENFKADAVTTKSDGIWNLLKPIGAVQQYSLQQGRQVIPFTELGSRLKRHVVGSGQYSASLARVLSRSTNLKASLYSWLPAFLAHTGRGTDLALAVTPFVKQKDGRKWEHFHWTGLESEIFDLPFGLLCVTGTGGGKYVHAEYLERCYVPNISKGYSAGSAMIVENVNIMVTRPVAFTTRQNDTLIALNSMFKHNQDSTINMVNFDPTTDTSL